MRDVCCVCLHRTRRQTPCGHSLCKHCLRRLRRRECPYCREEFSFEFGREEVQAKELAEIAPIASKELELLWNCDSFEVLHKSVSSLAPRLPVTSPAVSQSFRSGVAKQSSVLLKNGWMSILEANAAARVLTGFMEDGLVEASCALQTAIVDAMLSLSAGRPVNLRPSSAYGRRPASASTGRMLKPQEPLRNWVQKASLFASLVEARLLDGEPVSNLRVVLVDELRRSLRDFTAQDLLNAATELREGSMFLDSQGAIHAISEALTRQERLEGATAIAQARSVLYSLGLVTPVATSHSRRPTSACFGSRRMGKLGSSARSTGGKDQKILSNFSTRPVGKDC